MANQETGELGWFGSKEQIQTCRRLERAGEASQVPATQPQPLSRMTITRPSAAISVLDSTIAGFRVLGSAVAGFRVLDSKFAGFRELEKPPLCSLINC